MTTSKRYLNAYNCFWFIDSRKKPKKTKRNQNSCTCPARFVVWNIFLLKHSDFDVHWNRAQKEMELGDLRLIIKYVACAWSPEMFFHHCCRKYWSQYWNKKKKGWREETFFNINIYILWLLFFLLWLWVQASHFNDQIKRTDWSLFFAMNPCQNTHLYTNDSDISLCMVLQINHAPPTLLPPDKKKWGEKRANEVKPSWQLSYCRGRAIINYDFISPRGDVD